MKNEYRVVVKTRDIQHEKRKKSLIKIIRSFSVFKSKSKAQIRQPRCWNARQCRYRSSSLRIFLIILSQDKQLENFRRQSRTSLSTKISEMTEQLRAITNSRPDTRQKAQSAENPADEYLGHDNRNFTM